MRQCTLAVDFVETRWNQSVSGPVTFQQKKTYLSFSLGDILLSLDLALGLFHAIERAIVIKDGFIHRQSRLCHLLRAT